MFCFIKMGRLAIGIFMFIVVFFITRTTQLELDIIKDIGINNKELIQKEVYPVTISRIIAIKGQLKAFDESNVNISLKEDSYISTMISSNLKELTNSIHEETSGSNRGAFVIYDTNDYPYACNCNSLQYQNWKDAGESTTTKVECTNTINTGIFSSNNVDYCDPTNIAASQGI